MDIVHETVIHVPPDKVYPALTEQVKIASWYAEDTQAEPQIGSLAEFRFDRGTIRVEITQLETDRKIGWKVLQGLPGWAGMTGDITWLLTPYGNGTMINYIHSGWPTMDGPYPSVNFKSGWYMARLKSYVEGEIVSMPA